MFDRDAHEQNRRSWNAATVAHNRHKGDQAAALRRGEGTLFPEELDLLGDVAGRDLVHLQCNSGQDTLSLALCGARVTGVDLSDEAVTFATSLARDAGIPGRFVRSDVFDWFEATPDRFDVAFASYGAVGWLSELGGWGRGLHRVLRPGGRFVLVEFHPFGLTFGRDGARVYPYSTHGVAIVEPGGVNDYVAVSDGALGAVAEVAPFVNPHSTREYAWGLGDVVTALLDAGFTLERLVEWPYSNGWKPFDTMTALPGRRWATEPALPLMFGLVARR
jgi:SAM-dependent methyltransferase